MLAIVVVIWSPAGIYGYIVRKTGFFFFPLQRKVRFLGADKQGEEIAAKAEA